MLLIELQNLSTFGRCAYLLAKYWPLLVENAFIIIVRTTKCINILQVSVSVHRINMKVQMRSIIIIILIGPTLACSVTRNTNPMSNINCRAYLVYCKLYNNDVISMVLL